MIDPYALVGIFLVVAVIFGAAPIILAWLVSPKKLNSRKMQVYESGNPTFGETWIEFKPQYYLFGLAFVAFDVEAAFLFPWALAYNRALTLCRLRGNGLPGAAWRRLDLRLAQGVAGVGVGAVGQILLRIGGAFAMALVPLVSVLFLIWEARKVIARMQDRLGPTNAGTYAGPYALLQTFADGIKILTKELIIPEGADRVVFIAAPIVVVAVAIAVWAVVPLGPSGLQVVDLNVGAFYVVAISSLAPFSMIMAGWSSRNKYAEVGAFRAVSQIVGYEIPQILALLIPVLLTGSLSLQDIVRAQTVPFGLAVPLAALIYFLATVAEVGDCPSSWPRPTRRLLPAISPSTAA